MSSSGSATGVTLMVVGFVMAAPGLLFGPWFLYDGYVTYATEREAFLAREQLVEKHGRPGEVMYTALAHQNGWPAEPKRRTPTDIMTQKILGFGCSGVSVIALGVGLVGVLLSRRMRRAPAARAADIELEA